MNKLENPEWVSIYPLRMKQKNSLGQNNIQNIAELIQNWLFQVFRPSPFNSSFLSSSVTIRSQLRYIALEHRIQLSDLIYNQSQPIRIKLSAFLTYSPNSVSLYDNIPKPCCTTGKYRDFGHVHMNADGRCTEKIQCTYISWN